MQMLSCKHDQDHERRCLYGKWHSATANIVHVAASTHIPRHQMTVCNKHDPLPISSHDIFEISCMFVQRQWHLKNQRWDRSFPTEYACKDTSPDNLMQYIVYGGTHYKTTHTPSTGVLYKQLPQVGWTITFAWPFTRLLTLVTKASSSKLRYTIWLPLFKLVYCTCHVLVAIELADCVELICGSSIS
jgi:hypothetical protein